jgi:hypothetical protein
MFLINIPFKGCQGRSNRSSIVHAVSYFACGVNDTACIFKFFLYTIAVLHMTFTFRSFVHAVSMTTHAPCMRYQ